MVLAKFVRTDDVLGGAPRIDGTRVGVPNIHELAVDGGRTPADVADQLDLTLGGVYSALAYYHEHAEERRHVRRAHEEAQTELADRAVSPPEPASWSWRG